MCQKKCFICLLILIFFNICIISKNDDKIPFPKALEDASIKVNNINDILNGALVVGNGDINALIYSDSNSLILNLTKNDVWDARVETIKDPPIPTLDLIKQLGTSDTAFPLKGNNNSAYVMPEGKSWEGTDSYHSAAYPCPRQCAKIQITIKEKITDIEGEVNLLHAVALIKETDATENLVNIRALSNRNAFLIETSEQIQLEPIKSEDIPEATTGETNKVKWIKQEIPGDLDWPGMDFAVAVASIENRKAVAIVSSLESDDVISDAIKLAREIIENELALLIKNHESEWEKFWSRSGIEMDDKFLQSTWYRSLYFLRCFSKPGVQSVGLFAGLINDVPAWHGDYHTNYNIQQTYWTAYSANHPELAEPYDRLMSEYLTRAKWLSAKVFSMEGAYYPHVMYAYEPAEPDLCKSQNGRQYIHHTWGMTLGVNGFSIQPLWWRYKYDPDPARLKSIVYPLVREVATFYAEFIEQCEGNSTIRLGPSVSPEHWGWTKNLNKNYNCAFDIALIRYTLKAAIEAAQTLKQDELFVGRFLEALQRLPNYPIYGEDKPIVVDVENAEPIEYNIPVPSTPVFPGDVISWWSSIEDKQLFKRTIEGLKWNGNNATFMLAIARARLSMQGSQEWLANEIKVRTRPNATISLNALIPHKRFNDFGHYTEQFGVGMAISELLMQSVDDIIRIFPAVKKGNHIRIKNLQAQGGFLVTADGSSDDVEILQIKSIYGGELKLLSPWTQIEARATNNQNYLPLITNKDGVVTIKTKVGETWLFRKL
jgi:Glycosyl hydrolase family 95 catalytic domain